MVGSENLDKMPQEKHDLAALHPYVSQKHISHISEAAGWLLFTSLVDFKLVRSAPNNVRSAFVGASSLRLPFVNSPRKFLTAAT